MAEQTPTTAKDQLAKDKEVRQRIVDETAGKTEQVKPTPTQDENDRARMGEDVSQKEDDGSGPEVTLQVTAKPLGQHPQQAAPKSDKSEQDREREKQAYATRQQTPKPAS